ncbi:hypothetical protein CONPUDRAFT_161572, partial [Coniophora puteana RWD-64-598 SS2]
MAKPGSSQPLRRKRSKRRSPQPSHSSTLSPSPSALSVLASILASSHAALASPLPLESPPAFLCPVLARDGITPSPTTSHKPKAKPTSSASKPRSTPAPSASSSRTSGQIADRYVQGDDALWRKTDQWTLYGKTSLDDDALSPESTTASSSSKTSDVAVLDVSNLPAGWTDSSSSQSASDTKTYLILSLSICLAVAILSMMIGCMFWRKKRRRWRERQRKEDVELERIRSRSADSVSEDGERTREAMGRMRSWAKATARWKASIRQSARRRRNRRHFNKANRSCSPSLQDVRDSLSMSQHSPFSSPRSSTSHLSQEPSEISHLEASESNSSISNFSQLSILSPPAYNPPRSPENSPEPRRQMSPHLNLDQDYPPVNDHIPYEPGLVGHVSTDDKAHLARLDNLASAPPGDNSCGDIVPSGSAPQWPDDVDEPADNGLFLVAAPPAFSPLPPPPEKIKYMDLDYEAHAQLETLGQSSEPAAYRSSPPGSFSQSTTMFEPSAPSFEEELSPFEGRDASAPEWPPTDPFDPNHPYPSADDFQREARVPSPSHSLSRSSLSSFNI